MVTVNYEILSWHPTPPGWMCAYQIIGSDPLRLTAFPVVLWALARYIWSDPQGTEHSITEFRPFVGFRSGSVRDYTQTDERLRFLIMTPPHESWEKLAQEAMQYFLDKEEASVSQAKEN